jgi:hypothetical protein
MTAREITAGASVGPSGPARRLHSRATMRAVAVAVPLLSALLGVTIPSAVRAGTDRPVLVTVTGHAAIRLRLARGRTAPCDSEEDTMLFDAPLAPGEYRFADAGDMVCYQHTSAELPDSDWSVPRVLPTRMPRGGPLRLTLPTD